MLGAKARCKPELPGGCCKQHARGDQNEHRAPSVRCWGLVGGVHHAASVILGATSAALSCGANEAIGMGRLNR